MLMDHEAGRQCLLEIGTVLDRMQIPFFLMQGTALGAYRDRGFVPTERDIDLGVMQEYLRVEFLLSELMLRRFDVEAFTMPFARPRTVVAFKAYNGHVAKVDIVGLTRWKDKRFTATPVRTYITEPYCLVHDAHMVEEWQKIELFGREWNIPKDIEAYLVREYGDNWRVPCDDHVSRTRIYDYLAKEGILAELESDTRRAQGTVRYS